MKARDLKQADRERQQDQRAQQQDERQHLQEDRARSQNWRGRAQDQRANLLEERSRKHEERERGQEQREQRQDQRQLAQDQRDGQQDERESLRDLFVTVLGHDLRTPLSTIRLAAGGLRRRGALSGADASAVERIERAAGRMEAMASELLDLARARFAGGFQIQRSRADAVPLMTDLLEEFRGLHPDRPVRCELPASAEASFDRGKVAQVVSNLLRNAFEYAPAGTPISIRLVELPDSISIEVSNEGPAIPAAVQETLFDPFRHGRQASRHGLGLGLFIAKEIAAAHGGSLSFTSNDGETRFTVTLPRG